jgi:hypothetical protein
MGNSVANEASPALGSEPMADVNFLDVIDAMLAAGQAEVQRQRARLMGDKKVTSRSRSRRVVVPTETDQAAARKARIDLRRAGMLPANE